MRRDKIQAAVFALKADISFLPLCGKDLPTIENVFVVFGKDSLFVLGPHQSQKETD